MKSQKIKGGSKKHGRGKKKCETYLRLNKREKSHIRRIERHMKKYKDDSLMAKRALEKYRKALYGL